MEGPSLPVRSRRPTHRSAGALAVAAVLALLAARGWADSFLGSEANGTLTNPAPAGVFLWPIQPQLNGTQTRWEVTILYRIDPGFLDQLTIVAMFNVWNARMGVAANLFEKENTTKIDLPSVVLHEIGHAIALGHPNYERGGIADPPVFLFTGDVGSRCAQRQRNNSGLVDGLLAAAGIPVAECGRGPDGLFGTSDDVELGAPYFGPDDIRHYDDNNNDPFDQVCGTNVGRAIPVREYGDLVPAMPPNTPARWLEEAVMVQGAFPGEVQRDLHPADICALAQIEAALKAKWVAANVIANTDNRPVVYHFVRQLELDQDLVFVPVPPIVDCLGADTTPATADDIAVKCVPMAGCPGGLAGGVCANNQVFQPNKGMGVGQGVNTIDVFKRGNPQDSLALADNVYDVPNKLILSSDIYMNNPELGTLEPLQAPFVPGYPVPGPTGPKARRENDRESPTLDCNNNSTPDQVEVETGMVPDCDGNGVPDGCEPDCNNNGVADLCDLAAGTSVDANGNYTPDECEVSVPAVSHSGLLLMGGLLAATAILALGRGGRRRRRMT